MAWEEVELGQIATFSQGQQVGIADQKTEWFPESDVFVRIVNYTQDSLDIRYIPKQDSKYIVNEFDLVMVRYGAVGFVGRGIKGVIANNLFKIKIDNNLVNNDYLYRVLWSTKSQTYLKYISQSTSMPALSFKTVRKLKIPLPPLPIQKKIVAILDAADNYRQKTKVLIDKYDQLTQSIFLDMFGDPVRNEKGWEKKHLSEIGVIRTGNTPSRNEEKYFGDYIEWIKTDNINTPSDILTKASESLSSEGYQIGRKVPKDSILVTCIAGSKRVIGNSAIADREVCFNQQINSLTPNRDNVIFLHNQFKISKHYVQSFSTNSMKGMINKTAFSSIDFIIPPKKLQDEYCKAVMKIDEMKNSSTTGYNHSENLFQSLLQKAFKGELVFNGS